MTKQFLIGKYVFWSIALLGIVYGAVTLIGLYALNSPKDPIGNPWFTTMEVFTIFIALLMPVAMIAVHQYASPNDKMYSLAALGFMLIMVGITSCVHFVVLTVGRQLDNGQKEIFNLLFSFKWPSVVYVLDVLAWDGFFALSLLCAAPVFRKGRWEKTIRTLMVIGGLLSLSGLIGVPLGNMQVRNIGIIGYAVVAPFAFLLIGILLGRTQAYDTSQEPIP